MTEDQIMKELALDRPAQLYINVIGEAEPVRAIAPRNNECSLIIRAGTISDAS